MAQIHKTRFFAPSQSVFCPIRRRGLILFTYFFLLYFYVFLYTVDSRYLEVEGPLKHFEISVLRHIRFS